MSERAVVVNAEQAETCEAMGVRLMREGRTQEGMWLLSVKLAYMFAKPIPEENVVPLLREVHRG